MFTCDDVSYHLTTHHLSDEVFEQALEAVLRLEQVCVTEVIVD